VTQVLEHLLRLTLPLGAVGRPLVAQGLALLSLLFKSREKPKSAFREWLTRILSNLALYLTALTPRHFDSLSTQEIDMATAFEFVFDRGQSSQADKLLVKDFNEGLGPALSKVETLFKLLEMAL